MDNLEQLREIRAQLHLAYRELGELLAEDDVLLSFACYEIQDAMAKPMSQINRLIDSLEHNM